MKLRKSDIDSFEYEGNGTSRDIRRDDAVPGFGVRIYPTGRKSFVLNYRDENRAQRLYTLGAYGPLTLSEARKLATQRKADIIAGKDPVGERKAQRSAALGPTAIYQDVVEEFIEKYAKPRQRTWNQTERALKVNCAAWLKRPIRDITKPDAYSLIEGIQASGREATARTTLTWLRTLFKWATNRDYLDVSIMDAIEIEFHVTERDRYFSDDEIKALWNACGELNSNESAYVKLLLLTAVRKNELAKMSRAEFREDGTIWVVPHERTKTKKTQRRKREYIVPLPPLAQRIFKSVPKTEGRNDVFPGRYEGTTIYPGTSLQAKIIKVSGVEGFTFHAFRHTISTWFEDQGFSEYERGLLLNHTSTSVTAGYSHGYPIELKRQLLEQWADHVAGLVQPDGAVLLA